jgi:hypothetical protein
VTVINALAAELIAAGKPMDLPGDNLVVIDLMMTLFLSDRGFRLGRPSSKSRRCRTRLSSSPPASVRTLCAG